jgi:mono/diheme cytochrome c family protein
MLALCTPALAQDRQFVLLADPVLVESGLMQHLVPRFSMKTGTRIALGEADGAPDASLTTDAPDGAHPVIASGDTVWFLALRGDNAHAARFGDWLRSEIGQRTITAFAPDGPARFGPPPDRVAPEAAPRADRDVSAGVSLSLVHCGRCHVIGPENRHNGIGSTPSFAVLRALANWQERFESFYALNPHPAFTQIDDVTAPFDPARPSPIHPVRMTLDELDEIMAFVTRIDPADLGAPIRHQ